MLAIKQLSPNSKSSHPSDVGARTLQVVCGLPPTVGGRESRGGKREEEEILPFSPLHGSS